MVQITSTRLQRSRLGQERGNGHIGDLKARKSGGPVWFAVGEWIFSVWLVYWLVFVISDVTCPGVRGGWLDSER